MLFPLSSGISLCEIHRNPIKIQYKIRSLNDYYQLAIDNNYISIMIIIIE